MTPHDPYMESLVAQVAYRLQRGDTWAAIQTWFHNAYRDDPMSNLLEAQEQALQNANNAQAYNNLQLGETFGTLLPPGADIFHQYNVYFNVRTEVPGGEALWTTVKLYVTPTMTRGEIEQLAADIAAARILPGMGLGHTGSEDYEGPNVVQIGGIQM